MKLNLAIIHIWFRGNKIQHPICNMICTRPSPYNIGQNIEHTFLTHSPTYYPGMGIPRLHTQYGHTSYSVRSTEQIALRTHFPYEGRSLPRRLARDQVSWRYLGRYTHGNHLFTFLTHVSMDNPVSPIHPLCSVPFFLPLTGRSRIYATKIRQGRWVIKFDFISGIDLDVETADHNPPISK